MASEMPPSRYRRLRKASDISAFTAAPYTQPSKRMCTDKKHTSYGDRISSLPDELLLMIIDKLDTRTTITTTILSKRWRDLPRRLPTSYNLAVDDILPPRYHRLKRLNAEAKAAYEAEKNLHKLTDIYAVKARHERWMATIRPLTAILERYERRAMRRYVKQVNAFLLAPKDVRQLRPVRKLRLQLLGRWHQDIRGWVTAAIAIWGVEDLEIVVDGDAFCQSYNLRQLDGCYQNVRLERLALFNCAPTCAWDCLTLRRLTKLTLGGGSYMGAITSKIVRNCVELVDFRVTSSPICGTSFRIFAPASKIKTLQVDHCRFRKIYLMSLPCLETFVCRGRPTKLSFGEVPRLKHVSLDFLQTEDNDIDDETGISRTYPPSKFFKTIPPLACLALQFKGPKIDNSAAAERSAGGPCDGLVGDERQQNQYCRLKELVVAGFEGLGWQTGFVRLIMKRSPLLRRVHLLDGDVRDDEQELGALQIVPRHREWHECERAEVLDDLTAGFRFPPQIILE